MASLPVYESALEQFDLKSQQQTSEAYFANEIRDKGFVILRGKYDDKDFINIANENLSIEIPVTPLSVNTSKIWQAQVLWQSPDEFLVILPLSKKDAFFQKAQHAFKGIFAAVVDISGGFVCIELSGTRYLDVLQKVSEYEFNKHNFPMNKTVVTFLGEALCIFLRIDPEKILILLRFSFADYCWRLLEHASREYVSSISNDTS